MTTSELYLSAGAIASLLGGVPTSENQRIAIACVAGAYTLSRTLLKIAAVWKAPA